MDKTRESVWRHTKTVVQSSGGMVVARHPYAAQAGAKILREGGNAADAAVAASLVNGVVQPFANTIGGGGVAVVSLPGREPASIDYRYEAPAAAHDSLFSGTAEFTPSFAGWSGVANRANEIGALSVGVPGSIAGLSKLLNLYGTLSFRDIVEPSIALARDGYDTDWYGSLMQGVYLEDLLRYERTAETFLRNGVPHRPAVLQAPDRHVQTKLCQTLQRLAAEGPESFYSGELGQMMLRELEPPMGLFSAHDLLGYRPRLNEPRHVKYRGYTVLTGRHPSVGPLLLGILKNLDICSYEPSSAQRMHLLIEAIRIARTIEADALGESDAALTIEGELDSPELLASLAEAIDPVERSEDWKRLVPFIGESDPDRYRPDGAETTVNIAVVDKDRGCVCLTETILSNFGSMITTGSGILLNNAMYAFNPTPGMANSIGPRLRPLSNMTPLVVATEDVPVLCLGASGGRRISVAVAQILSLVLDHDWPLQDAVSAPRVDVVGGDVLIDSRFPAELLRRLESMGHRLIVKEESLASMNFANPGGIRILPSNDLISGVNPLQTTSAVGY